MRATGYVGAGVGILLGGVFVGQEISRFAFGVTATEPSRAVPVVSNVFRWMSLGLAILLGVPDSTSADVRDDRAATQLRAAGARVTMGKDGRITGIVLWAESRVSNGDLVCLNGLMGLRSIVIQDTHLTDAGIAHLKNLPTLETLWLGGSHTDAAGKTRTGGMAFTDATLAHLSGIKTLKRLILTSTGFTDAGLVHLKGLTNLRWLGLSSPGFSDAGLSHVAGLTGLEDLNLTDSSISGRGLSALAVLPNLRSLSIGPNTFDVETVKPIADLPHLRIVLFYKSKFSPDGLASLERLTRLESLQFLEMPLLPARLAGLKRAMPTTSITYEEQERVMSVLSK